MPTLEVERADLETLIGETLSPSRFLSLLSLVKGEIKGDPASRETTLKIELNDTNRPDLWSPEGIARQIRTHLKGTPVPKIYPFFNTKAQQRIEVSMAVMAVRPYLAGLIVRGLQVTPQLLTQLIQSQEKIAEIFGQKRKSVSIGLYPLQKIKFPLQYDLADPETTRFTPLGFDHPMSLGEILKSHPKGIAYGEILQGQPRLPLLSDAQGQILSFPPIINSREMGEVVIGDTDLLVEVTGCNLRMVVLAANIFACNLFDRGYGGSHQKGEKMVIEPVEIVFPEETAFGRSLKTPYDFSESVCVATTDFERALGESVSCEAAQAVLTAYGYQVTGRGKTFSVRLPPYRDDVMHPIDIVEDFVIGRGLETFMPVMPSLATIGIPSPASLLTDELADTLVGLGFEEVLSNLLLSHEEQGDRMRMGFQTDRPERRVISLENPMTDRHATPRSWLLPLLLRVEAASAKVAYPHRLFEIGEVARLSASQESCETALHLAALQADPHARFSDLHAVLFALLHTRRVSCQIIPVVHPTFIEGRAGLIVHEEREMGLIGEVHPEVLTLWGIGMPAVAFELCTASLA